MPLDPVTPGTLPLTPVPIGVIDVGRLRPKALCKRIVYHNGV